MKTLLAVTLFFFSQANYAEDLNQLCAQDICGAPRENFSTYYHPGNLNQYSTPESRVRLPEVTELAQTGLARKIEYTQKLLMAFDRSSLPRNFDLLDNSVLSTLKNSIQFSDPEVYEAAGGESECQAECRKVLKNFVLSAKFSGLLDVFSKEAESPDLAEAVFTCQTMYLSTQPLPEITEDAELTKDLTEKITLLTQTLFGEDAADHFHQYVTEKLKYNRDTFTNSEEYFFENLRSLLDLNFDPNQTQKNHLEQILSTLSMEDGKLHLFSRTCADHRMGIGGDGFSSEEDTIYISPFSRMFPKIGKAVLGHELGHVLTSEISRKNLGLPAYEKMVKLRQCVNSQSPGETRNYPYDANSFQDDLLTTEEDTADVIGQYLFPKEAVLDKCALLRTSADGKKYLKTSLQNSASENHSSALLRVIRARYNSGSPLPLSCQRLLTGNKDVVLKRCL